MHKLIVFALALVTLLGCKDEFNIPVYDSYVDGDDPIITIVSPSEDTVYIGESKIAIHIEFKDDYELSEVEFDLQPTNGSFSGINFKETLSGDSTYTYQSEFIIPTTDSTRYEIYIQATDLVGNTAKELYFITTK
jgi:hypothetical protein